MSVSVTRKKQCVTCNKSGGIMTCDGCQQSFCGKHSVEHRQELTNQLDGIMQEHDSLQHELEQSSVNNALLKQIDKWEKESITKIQTAAEAARADLREMIEKSKKQLSEACHDIAVNLRSSREADDFSEDDLTRWMERLRELRLEITSPSSIQLVKDKHSPISLITIAHSKQISPLKNPIPSVVQEKFSQVFGVVTLEEEGFVARHVGRHGEYAHILGERLYSQGRQVVRFQIGYEKAPYNTFFGCISSRATNNKINFCSPSSAGWFGCNQIYQQGRMNENSYDSSEIRTNDVLSLTFDCEKQQIELYHERQNKTNKLQIDIRKAPFPWRLLLVLCRLNDCVRILPNI